MITSFGKDIIFSPSEVDSWWSLFDERAMDEPDWDKAAFLEKYYDLCLKYVKH